jgi:hypothetical protein
MNTKESPLVYSSQIVDSTQIQNVSVVIPRPENIPMEELKEGEKLLYTADGQKLDAAKASQLALDGVTPLVVVERLSTSMRVWGVFGGAFKGRGTMTFTGYTEIRGLPVAGCYTEWAPAINGPHFGDAVFNLLSVQCRGSEARIVGYQDWGNLNTAAGLIIPM